MMEDQNLIDAVWGGTKTMRKAREKYLPSEPNESDKAYAIRLARSTFFNQFRKVIRRLVNKPFNKPVTFDGFVGFEDVLADADLSGTRLEVFMKKVFTYALRDGLTFILVDYPQVSQNITLAEERENNIRPYLVHIQRDRVIGWRFSTQGAKDTLTQVRIREKIQRPVDEFHYEEVERVRVLEPGIFKVYERVNVSGVGNVWQIVEEGTTTLNFIPLVPLYTNQTGLFQAEPPLLDLAFLNVEHWQSSSDQRNILHVARVPILFGAGIPSDESGKFEVGPNTITRVDNPAARLEYVEHTGKAIESGRQDIQDTEQRMTALGVELLLRKKLMTATESAGDRADVDSELGSMVIATEDSFILALEYVALWLGRPITDVGKISIHKDFAVDLSDSTDLEHLYRARSAGDLTHKTYLEELIRRNVLADSIDVDAEIENSSLENPDIGLLA